MSNDKNTTTSNTERAATNEGEFFQQVQDAFINRVKKASKQRDWNKVELEFFTHGSYLELEPDALQAQLAPTANATQHVEILGQEESNV